MPTKVTLKLFSGRPNPTFVLNSEQTKEIDDICASLGGMTTSAPAGKRGGLGFRGFRLQGLSADRGAPREMYAHAGIIDRNAFNNTVDPKRLVEKKLLEFATANHVISPRVQAYLEKEVQGPPQLAAPAVATMTGCPACVAADAPAYDPNAWNSDPTITTENNCYNYANNQITYTFAQPGRHSGHPANAMECPSVQQAAISDGLATSADFSTPLAHGQGWYVALVIWPDEDYHWFRQDSTGCWSHKPGGTDVTNLDDSNNPITNPRLSNNGPYTDFCTFMVTSAAVVIS